MTGENALRILRARYLQKDENGEVIESPEEMYQRVADDIAKAEEACGTLPSEQKKLADQFFHMMNQNLFLPNSPTLMNSGVQSGLSYHACFVLPVPDTMEGIFSALRAQGLIQKAGGGTGFSFSRLRPKGDFVKKTSGVSSGPLSFITLFDAVTETVKQGGKRRGANMAILRVDHPDIEEFITCKDKDNIVLKNFNISVAITDSFMDALAEDKTYYLINPRTDDGVAEKGTQEMFDLIAEHAWRTGDPGVFFIDRANELEMLDAEIEATNPCGEQPLTPNEPCTLGSINVGKFATPDRQTDWDHLRKIIHVAVRFLDNVIDRSSYPIPQISRKAKQTRRIGLGIMGWADYLVKRGIPYDSDDAISAAFDMAQFLQEEALKASIDLAQDRGPFPAWKKSSYKDDKEEKVPRNVARTTIAPTGTISRIAECSSGIEPYYALAYKSNILDGQVLMDKVELLEEMSKTWEQMDEELYPPFSKPLWGTIADLGGSIKTLDFPSDFRALFKTALEIPVERHVNMQAAFQRFTDNAVSKTVNLPNSATVEDVKKAYLLAYKLGCKGITVYRDGSKTQQVLETSKSRDGVTDTKLQSRDVRTDEDGLYKAPDILPAVRVRIPMPGHGTLFATVSYDPDTGKPLELFGFQGKAGGCTMAYMEGLGRMISISLRSGVPVEAILEALRGISCRHGGVVSGQAVMSPPDALAIALVKFLENRGVKVKIPETVIGNCPMCGELLVFAEGCERCVSDTCGYTRCG